MLINDICKRDVATVDCDADARDAAQKMRAEHVGDVVVVENQAEGSKPLGILTDRDLVLEILAEDVDPRKVLASDIMSREIQTISGKAEMSDALRRMSAHGVRRLVVVDERGNLDGILALDDLIGAMAGQLESLALVASHQQKAERRTRV